ncbi:cytochrome b/b6 domain-containing protein [Erythrobacter ani]|uniref:Cytochrome b/b6 domain-containing protein n=1 Tax=Erythrobacter ani TaxID=2827235 RepID=A0ABS6SNS4_9SPHN|nr:cytochrome b/b6 domain-containing protein [Erythrobacter ani]MBV7266639.1 cytochrome b/b6 domain-containing protein [Erythrobacter ani]
MTTRPVKVWDLPVRLSHWSFVGLVFAMWYTSENSLWWWHTRLGVVLLGVLIFRIVWGIIGTRTARFANFVRGPSHIIAYLRGQHSKDANIGHNPLGALAVIALLSVMLVQVGMGLFAGDPYDGATGPLNGFVGVLTADMLTEWHEIFFYVVLGMIGLHITAIGVYAFIRMDDIVGPMVTGKREAQESVEGIASADWGRVAIAFVVAAGIALWVWFGAPPLS